METFKDILSTIDHGIVDKNPKYNGIEKLEKVRDYLLKNNLDKILICHITAHINTMIESNEKLEEEYIELRKLLLHWYDYRYVDRYDKNKYILSIFGLNSSE